MRVLVAASASTWRTALTDALAADGFSTSIAADEGALRLAFTSVLPDVLIVDHDLDRRGRGAVAARQLLECSDAIVMLCGVPSTEDRVAGFAAGFDECLGPDADPHEIVARLDRICRLIGRRQSRVVQVDDLLIDHAAQAVVRAGAHLPVTRIEFQLLVALARHPGHVVSKETLLQQIWDGDAFDPNLVEVHMSSLRRKLEQAGPRLIQTVRGAGYVLRASSEAPVLRTVS